MKTTFWVAAFFLCIAMNVFSQTQTISAGTLTINAGNFSSDEGRAIAKLFRQDDDVPSKPFMELSAEIRDGKAVIVFTDIPYGEYAAILQHDQNSNGKVDHNFLGFPKEPLGFSNGWKLTIFSGMPSFSKLKFEFVEQNPNYEIDID